MSKQLTTLTEHEEYYALSSLGVTVWNQAQYLNTICECLVIRVYNR